VWFIGLEFALAVVTFVALRFITAPYGRFRRPGWGPAVPARLGWVLMEGPSALLFAIVFGFGPHRAQVVPLVFLAMWELHYGYRAFVYPFLRRGRDMPLLVVGLGLLFNGLNAPINAYWVGTAGHYPASWLADPRFLAGAALFLTGFVVNLTADRTLRRLRRPGETGYQVPTGGLYRYVSSPNYFGEIVEWCGWALATWSPAGLAFAVYTFANLAPRGIDHHAWYRERFPDYPPERRALIPFVW
jgi:3-oxo-5-alpha-steroid 4-dehydrogenase 1